MTSKQLPLHLFSSADRVLETRRWLLWMNAKVRPSILEFAQYLFSPILPPCTDQVICVYLSIYLYIYLSIYLSVYLSIYIKGFIAKWVNSILVNLRFKLLKYKENKKICNTFDHNFKDIPLYIMRKVSLERYYFVFYDGALLKCQKWRLTRFAIKLHIFIYLFYLIYLSILTV